MNVSEALQGRRSIRYFKDTPVPTETLREIVSDAQWAPSWANAQPWRVYIATGEAVTRLQTMHLQNSQQGRRGRSDMETGHREDWGDKAYRNMDSWGSALQDFLGREAIREFPMSQAELFKAPAIAYLTMNQGSPLWSVYDMGAFGQSLMLSAKEHGVDSIAAYELVKYPENVRSVLGIPSSEAIVIGIALGYADERKINEFRSDREPLEDVLTIKSK